MNQPALQSADEKEPSPLTVIRTETALSRFPFHRLAKKGLVQIEIRNQASALLWEVTYNSKYGQPGPLAYKLDTLVINRKIEEEGRPVPEIIRLGSLAQIAAELGLNRDTNSVKTALLQNAFAAVNAKISYRAADRTEKTLEAAFTRYAVVFTGEKLPNGHVADAVHLVLQPIYADVLNAAITRPLDYDYMKTLPPAAQRFYEIVSYQIYAALHFQNDRARLRYSDYCLLSTATRYFDFDHVKKQMYKIHKPHLDSGYLAKVSYEDTVDSAGQPDWWMYYVPGPNASLEYRQFTGNLRKVRESRKPRETSESTKAFSLLFTEFEQSDAVPPVAPAPGEPQPEDTKLSTLIEQLAASDLNRVDAERLAREKPEECQRQLAYLPFVTEFKTSRGAYLRRAIEQGFAPPAGFTKKQIREEKQLKEEGVPSRDTQQAAQDAREREKAMRVDEDMVRLEKDAPEAFSSFCVYVASERLKEEDKYLKMPTSVRSRMMQIFESSERQRKLFQEWRDLSSSLPSTAEISSPHPHPAVPRVALQAAMELTVQEPAEDNPEAIRALVTASLQQSDESQKEEAL